MFQFRAATPDDIPAMHRVRLVVRENALSDPSKVRPADYHIHLTTDGCGWVCEANNQIVAFAIANSKTGNIWALFVDPLFEGRGLGRQLHDIMITWLFDNGPSVAWLTTEPNTRAEAFYRKAGWTDIGVEPSGEIRFEKRRSA